VVVGRLSGRGRRGDRADVAQTQQSVQKVLAQSFCRERFPGAGSNTVTAGSRRATPTATPSWRYSNGVRVNPAFMPRSLRSDQGLRPCPGSASPIVCGRQIRVPANTLPERCSSARQSGKIQTPAPVSVRTHRKLAGRAVSLTYKSRQGSCPFTGAARQYRPPWWPYSRSPSPRCRPSCGRSGRPGWFERFAFERPTSSTNTLTWPPSRQGRKGQAAIH